MANFNQIIIAGQLGQDVEVRYAGDKPVINLSVATNNEWMANDGKKMKRTYWHRVSYFGKHAQILVDQFKLKKGDSVLINGELRYKNYQDDAGVDKQTTEIRATSVQIVKSKATDGKDDPVQES